MSSNIVRLYDENVTTHPSANVPGFVGIDYDRLAEAILAKQEEQKQARRAAKSAAGAAGRKTAGANGTVDPIRSKADIIRIAQYFADRGQPRNELMFLIGCSVGLRGSDLSRLRVGDFKPPAYQARIKEQKTGKIRVITLNAMAIEAYHALLASLPSHSDDTYLFQSQRTGNRNIERHSFARILRQAQHDLSLPYRLGTHSMRKTFAYHVFMDNQQTPEVLAYLQRLLNHRDSATTLRYIGLEQKKEQQLYRTLDFGFTLNDIKEE